MFEVYLHTSPSGKAYVGWTSQGHYRRWKQHVILSRNGSTAPFHRAIRKYGEQTFGHQLLERVSTQKSALVAEALWIKELSSMLPRGYNATLGGEGQSGRFISEETRAKMAAAQLGKKRPPFTDEHRANMAKARIGKKHSPEHCESMRKARLGHKSSEETKAKLSAIFKGRKPKPVDEATRKKMSESAKKRPPQEYTPERAARISAALTGKKATIQGEDRHQSKLTAAMVAEIRAALPSAVGYGKLKALADKFGISSSAICDIRAGRTWKVAP